MAKIESKYIIFKKGIEFNIDFCSRGYGNMVVTARFTASGKALLDEVVIEQIEVDQDFMKDLFLDYLTVKDLPDILDGIYNDEDGKTVIEDIVLHRIDEDAAKWTIYIEPHLWPYPTTPERSELEYEVKFICPSLKLEFDLDNISRTDDHIRLSSEKMDQFIESLKIKELDAAFYEKYMDDVARHPDRHK